MCGSDRYKRNLWTLIKKYNIYIQVHTLYNNNDLQKS